MLSYPIHPDKIKETTYHFIELFEIHLYCMVHMLYNYHKSLILTHNHKKYYFILKYCYE